MGDFFDYETTSARCLRSTPISALLSLLLVFFGVTAFAGGTIYFMKNLTKELKADHINHPFVDYTVYAIVGTTGIFGIILYVVCIVSSGWNAKRCFEGSRKSAFGRCLNGTLLVCLVFAVLIWAIILACLSYPLISMILLIYREDGPARVALSEDAYVRNARQIELESTSIQNDNLRSSSVISNDPREIISKFFSSNNPIIDLSYYGVYNHKGYPMIADKESLGIPIRNLVALISLAVCGSYLILIGYISMLIFVAMNLCRLKEMRYYDATDDLDRTQPQRH